jgi:glycosyltransferase involved in cell wall biosynthesis
VATFKRLSFVFPAWNEEEMLSQTVVAATEAGLQLVDVGEIVDYEIVLVDDGSSDRTPALVDELASAHDQVRGVHHDRNRGLGASERSGFEHATGDIDLYTDADLPFDLLLLHKAFRLLRIYDADIVSMYRFDRTAEGPKRYIYSHLYNWLVRTALNVRLRDVNFAGKLIRRDVLDRVDLRSEGSFIDVELMAQAQRLGFNIIQFGVDYFPRTRGDSTLAAPTVILGIIRELTHERARLRRVKPLPSAELQSRRTPGP